MKTQPLPTYLFRALFHRHRGQEIAIPIRYLCENSWKMANIVQQTESTVSPPRFTLRFLDYRWFGQAWKITLTPICLAKTRKAFAVPGFLENTALFCWSLHFTFSFSLSGYAVLWGGSSFEIGGTGVPSGSLGQMEGVRSERMRSCEYRFRGSRYIQLLTFNWSIYIISHLGLDLKGYLH